ncbi:MAG: hypothetical protein AAGA47_12905 [Pseudomonadota bacterium]
MRPLITAFVLSLTFTSAYADDLEDRYFEAQQAFEDNMRNFYSSISPEVGAKFPRMMEDERVRGAMRCGLDFLRAEGGESAAEAMVEWVERAATTPIEEFEDLAGPPSDQVDETLLLAAADACNSIEISMELMEESGFMDAMTSPEVLQKMQEN